MRLELARRNSQSQHSKYIPSATMEKPVEDTIYEGIAFKNIRLGDI